jgi:hypothetical protein
MGKPPPGRGTFGWPKASCNAGGLRHRAARAIAEDGAMPMPPTPVHGRWLHDAAEARQEEGTDAPRKSPAGVTVGRRRAPPARQRGSMTAGGVALPPRQEEDVAGGARRAPAIAPGGLPNLTAPGQERFGLQPRGPLAGHALQDSGPVRNQRMPPWTIRPLIPRHTGEARRLPTAARSQALQHACWLTSCHSAKSHYLSGLQNYVSGDG